MSTIISGFVCDNTCIGFSPGDDTPDYLGLFGPTFGQLGSQPFTLNLGILTDSLTIGGHTFTWAVSDPHVSISFTSPLLASFAPGAAVFTAIGTNPFGFAVAEAEYLCPSVPEPATWILMALGLVLGAVISPAGIVWRLKRELEHMSCQKRAKSPR